MEQEVKKYYLNNGQQYVHTIDPNSLTLVGARRFGKSSGINGPRTLRKVQQMPRSVGFIYADTFTQALTRTIPETLAALERIGYKENIHYFVGRKAPEFMKFPTPYVSPKQWDKVIHWYNGSIIIILSQEVRLSANSLTTDWGLVDEARAVKHEKFTQEVLPTLSGTPGKFDDCHYKKGVDVVSDRPFGKAGSWFLKHKTMMDTDLLKSIEGSIFELNKLRASKGEGYTEQSYDRLLRHHAYYLSQMRKHLHLYVEYDTIENLEVVGVDYIEQQKRLLPPLTFEVSILNKERIKNKHGFYPNFDRLIHTYDSYDINHINNIRTDAGTLDLKRISEQNCLHDSDIDSTQPLFISFDFNNNINWVVTAQQFGNDMRTLGSLFTKHEQKLRALLESWNNYYQYHPTKDVVVYYDSTATKSAYADEYAESFIDIIYNTLTAHHWAVSLMYVGNPMAHDLKHQYIDDALTGRKYLFPRFNKGNNEHLIPAIEMAGVKRGRNGFEKDKSGEKYAETEEDLLEYRTDGTDAWDTLFIGMNFFPFVGGSAMWSETSFR